MSDRAEPDMTDEERIAAALKPFGWTCGADFWQRYYSDAWVFNLANAVVSLNVEVERLAEAGSRTAIESIRAMPVTQRMQVVGLTTADILDVIERAES